MKAHLPSGGYRRLIQKAVVVRKFLSSSMLAALVAGLLVSLTPQAANAATYGASPASTWVPNGTVRAIAVTPTRIYLGGDFTSLKNPYSDVVVTRQHLAAIDRATGNPTSWAPATNDENASNGRPAVSALAVGPDGTVYVGGDFTTIGGASRSHAAAVSAAGAVTGWAANTAGGEKHVWDLKVSGDKLFMAGQFTSVNGVTRPGVAKVDLATGAVDTSFDAHTPRGIQALTISGGQLVIGGTFTSVAGQPREFLAAVDASTGALHAWNPPSQCVSGVVCRIRDLDSNGSDIYAAIGGEPGGKAARWTLGTDTPEWVDRADGEVQAVDYYDGVAYFGGHFSNAFHDPGANGASHARNQFAAVNATSGMVLNYALPTIDPALPGVWTIQADATGLRLGGSTQVANQPFARFLTFAASGVVIAGPQPGQSTIVTVKTKGCPTCKVRLVSRRGTTNWTSSWVKASKSIAKIAVLTSRTDGLSVQIKAPWEKRLTKTTEVVMRYKGKKAGQKVTAAVAATKKQATSCFKGTSSASLALKVVVQKVVLGGKVGTRAWTAKTKVWRKPMRKAPKGILSVKGATLCR